MTTAPTIAFDTYHDYEAMTAHLKALAEAYPDLATLRSLGKTFQGRDVWAMTITNPKRVRRTRSRATTSMPRSTRRNMRRARWRSTRYGAS